MCDIEDKLLSVASYYDVIAYIDHAHTEKFLTNLLNKPVKILLKKYDDMPYLDFMNESVVETYISVEGKSYKLFYHNQGSWGDGATIKKSIERCYIIGYDLIPVFDK